MEAAVKMPMPMGPLDPPPKPPPGKAWYSLKDGAEILGLHPETLRLYCVNGTFTAFGHPVYRQGKKWFVLLKKPGSY